MTTFKEYLINEAKTLSYNPEFVFANKQVFDADFAVHPSSPEAQKVISKIQQPKIDHLAKMLDITWTMLFASNFEQRDWGNKRMVWSYILVGNDKEGNEIAYYKYEGGTAGAGQSHVYGNRKNKTKLSWLLDSTPAKAKERLGFTKIAAGGPIPTDEDELIKLLKRRFRKSRITHDDNGRMRLVIPLGVGRWSKRQEGLSFILKSWGKKTKVNYEHLDNAKEVKQGYHVPGKQKYHWIGPAKPHVVGTFDDVNEMLAKMRKAIKYYKDRY